MSKLEYLQAPADTFPLLDFSLYFGLTDLSDISTEYKNPFQEDPLKAFDFINSNLSFVNFLNSLNYAPTLIETSLNTNKYADENSPTYIVSVLCHDDFIQKQYIEGIRNNVNSERISGFDYGPITHHPSLNSSPFYYKIFDSNYFSFPLGKEFNKPELRVAEYHLNPKYIKSTVSMLAAIIEKFFDKINQLYSALDNPTQITSGNTKDLAILIPLPKPGVQFQRFSNLSGGCIFLFGSVTIPTDVDSKSFIYSLIFKVRQYLIDSILQQTLLIPQNDVQVKSREEGFIHELKNSLNLNIKVALSNAYSTSEIKDKNFLINQSIAYTEKLINRIEKYLKTNSQHKEFIGLFQLQMIAKEEISLIANNGISASIDVSDEDCEVLSNTELFRDIIKEILINSQKQMNKLGDEALKEIKIKFSFIKDNQHRKLAVQILNSGTVFTDSIMQSAGLRFPTNREEGSTGWGFRIIHNALKNMDAYSYKNDNNETLYLLLENIVDGEQKWASSTLTFKCKSEV